MTIPTRWAFLRPPPLLPRPLVTADAVEGVALTAAIQWHEALQHLPGSVLSPAARAACYDDLPGMWQDTIRRPITADRPRFVIPPQFNQIAVAHADLLATLDWNLGEIGWLYWSTKPHVQRQLPPRTQSTTVALAYMRTMVGIEDGHEVIVTLQRVLEREPAAFDLWATYGFALLAYGPPVSQTGEDASQAFVRALDALPEMLRDEAADFLLGYAALADLLADQSTRALERLNERLHFANAPAVLQYQAVRCAVLHFSLEEMLEDADRMVVQSPHILLRLATDPVVRASRTGAALLPRLADMQLRKLTAERDALLLQQRQVTSGARFRVGLPASALAERIDLETISSAVDALAARHAVYRLADDQANAIRTWRDAEQALSAISEQLSILPGELRFRIPRALGNFQPTVTGDVRSDWALIEQLARDGQLSRAVRHADALEKALPASHALALAEMANLQTHALYGLLRYAEGLPSHQAWAAEMLDQMREAAQAASEIHRRLDELGRSRDEARVTPRLKAAWAMVQRIGQLWMQACRLVPDARLECLAPTITVPIGDWRTARVEVVDGEGYLVHGLPVYWDIQDPNGHLAPRWPHKALTPGFSVSLATGEAHFGIEAPADMGETSSVGTKVELRAGLAPTKLTTRMLVVISRAGQVELPR